MKNNNYYERTIKNKVNVTGIGLHSGNRIKMEIYPYENGIAFQIENEIINVNPYLINETTLSTTIIMDNGLKIGTIEHLMSACAGLGIDNILIKLTKENCNYNDKQINNYEVPIMDGSSMPFIFLLKEAGIKEIKNKPKFGYLIKDKVIFEENDKYISVEPFKGSKIEIQVDFSQKNNKYINNIKNNLVIDFTEKGNQYINEISRARTFCFSDEIEYMKSNNLALGGNLNNAIVFNNEGFLNKNLRYKDEFVRHKILDTIGDFWIIGKPIIGYFKCYKNGHDINNKFIRKLIESHEKYEIVNLNNLSL